MRASFPRPIRGFTLIELLVTLSLVTVLGMLAVPSLQSLVANQRLSASASEFQSAAMQARSTALKNNQRVLIQPTAGAAGAWKDGYRIFADADLDSTFNGSDTVVLTAQALPSGVTISKFSGTNNFFGYEGNGFLASIGGSANSTWLIAATGTDRKKYLVIERSGRARLCDTTLDSSCPP